MFCSAVDAVRFCHASQALLMYSYWPDECKDYICATEVRCDVLCLLCPACFPRMAALHANRADALLC